MPTFGAALQDKVNVFNGDETMNVAIRADASVQIGSGHIMRCLTLADQLRNRKAIVTFICNELPGHLCSYIEDKGFKVQRLHYDEIMDCNSWKEDAKQTEEILRKSPTTDWMIVDHYGLDNRWEFRIKHYARNIMVIDDLANRPHDCGLLLDQNFYINLVKRYDGLVPENCRMMLGPAYALLRPEFREARKKRRDRDGTVNKILVFFGGSDPANETSKTLEALRRLNRSDIAVDVVVGNGNPYKDQVRKLCSEMLNTKFYCQVENMAELMASADLSIGAGGATTLERCFIGLPTMVLIVAENQLETTTAVAETGAIFNMGWSHRVDEKDLADGIKNFIADPIKLQRMTDKAVQLMQGDKNNQVFDTAHQAIFLMNGIYTGR